jgi:TP901-1 family phage major tail protein
MQAQSGALMLIKIKINDIYEVVGGLRTTKVSLNNDLIDVSSKSSGKWRELLSEVGVSSLSISGSGIFTNSESEKLVKDLAYNNKKAEYQLTFGNGEIVESYFIINNYERSGNYQEEENYSLTLESTGNVIWKS